MCNKITKYSVDKYFCYSIKSISFKWVLKNTKHLSIKYPLCICNLKFISIYSRSDLIYYSKIDVVAAYRIWIKILQETCWAVPNCNIYGTETLICNKCWPDHLHHHNRSDNKRNLHQLTDYFRQVDIILYEYLIVNQPFVMLKLSPFGIIYQVTMWHGAISLYPQHDCMMDDSWSRLDK